MTQLDLASELEKIIAKGAINPVFQPIFNILEHKILGFEALSRGPEHSPLFSPVPLFQTAEYCGKLSELETLCRRISLEQFKLRQFHGKLFINISPKALLDPAHPKGMTLQLLQKLGIPPSQVVIELSEQYPADDIDLLKACLNHYRGQGFLTAIDDLGAGYSGLRLWSELAPDYVKIDRHFIQQIDSTPVKQEFVRSIVELCQSLTCKVIAEGIETQEELTVLKQLGIIYCQGYLLGKPDPLPCRAMKAMLVNNNTQVQPRYNESAESLCTSAITVTTTLKLKHLSDTFTNQPALQAVVVVADDVPQGIISRATLLELFSTPYGRALHENHAVSEVMDPQVLQIEANEPLSNVSQLLTSESANTVAQQFIILRRGQLLGIGHTKDLLQRITEHRIKMARHANPLTSLPGNVPIQEELKRLQIQQKPFYLAYFDLSHFKPYNDVYGFCRGDEVITEVANLLLKNKTDNCFVGHVGGDDFVLISTNEHILTSCKQVINQFETAKQFFYGAEHWQTQQMLADDRQGQRCYHPLISLCVGILPPALTFNCHEHNLSTLSAKAKKQAKSASNGFCLLETLHAVNTTSLTA